MKHHTLGGLTIDVTPIIHQFDSARFLKVQLIHLMWYEDLGAKAFISEMELIPTP
jgi:hypothetical protein